MKNEIHEYVPEDEVIFNLLDEDHDLAHKIIRLKNFLKSGKIIGHDQREFMENQYDAMLTYLWCLFERIHNLIFIK